MHFIILKDLNISYWQGGIGESAQSNQRTPLGGGKNLPSWVQQAVDCPCCPGGPQGVCVCVCKERAQDLGWGSSAVGSAATHGRGPSKHPSYHVLGPILQPSPGSAGDSWGPTRRANSHGEGMVPIHPSHNTPRWRTYNMLCAILVLSHEL